MNCAYDKNKKCEGYLECTPMCFEKYIIILGDNETNIQVGNFGGFIINFKKGD